MSSNLVQSRVRLILCLADDDGDDGVELDLKINFDPLGSAVEPILKTPPKSTNEGSEVSTGDNTNGTAGSSSSSVESADIFLPRVLPAPHTI